MLAWLSVCSEVQTCIWPSWCHCYTLSLASVKSRLVSPFWYRLTRVVPERGPLNGCVCVIPQKLASINRLISNNFAVNQIGHNNGRIRVLVIFYTKAETCEWCSPLALISGFEPINKWCYVFWQNCKTVQISDVSDVKTANIVFKIFINQKINRIIFLTINRLTFHYFPYFCSLISTKITYSSDEWKKLSHICKLKQVVKVIWHKAASLLHKPINCICQVAPIWTAN